MDTPHKLSRLTIALHWTVAVGIISLLAVGIYMARTETWALFELHKSIGLMVFALIIARVAWRLKNGWPTPVRPLGRHEHRAAVLVHWALLICTLLMPLSGMLFSGASGHGFGIFSWKILQANTLVDAAGEVLPFNAGLAELGEQAHGLIGYFLLALIVLHAAAALKHHLLDRDTTLTRMLGAQNKNGRRP